MAYGSARDVERLRRPPLRSDPWTPDGHDSARVEYARRLWHSQDNLFLKRDRQIEENVRMLAGQQWAMWSRILGRFVDISHWFTDREKRWRQRPVFQKLLGWFMLTHARLTENPPIVAFQPATGDRLDADLAEVMDPCFKSLWSDVGMLGVIDQIASWLCPGGSVYWKTGVDPNLGDLIEWMGQAELTMEAADGSVIRRQIEGAPFDQDGRPLAQLVGNGDEWEPTGKAFQEHEGGLQVDVYSPIQVRGQWGNLIPWERKAYHQLRTFLTPDEVYDRFGVECEPDARGADQDRVNSLQRVLFGAGFFGAIENLEDGLASFDSEGAAGYVDVLETWERPVQFRGMQQGPDRFEEPGGRLLVVTRNKVLRDGPRPAPYPRTSPIRHLSFVNLPGRPQGTSPQDALNPLQRTYNRRWAQVLEHANLMTNPIGIADKSQGINKGDITDEPGQIIYANRKSGSSAPPLEYAKPPALGEDSWRVLAQVRDEFDATGSLEGTGGRPPTRDPSGELIKELRFNEDRYIAATARRFAIELGYMVEDWMVTLPYIWDRQKLIAWAGEDQVLRTVLVDPKLFEQGKVNVVPDIESMLPEGRGERIQRVTFLWQNGAYGEPASLEARSRYFALARFPHMARAHRPGGVHRIMAEHENGRLAQGVPAAAIPIFPWQDHEMHLHVHTEFMAGPDYQRLPVQVQQQFTNHWLETRAAMIASFQSDVELEAQRQLAAGTASVATAAGVQQTASQLGVLPELPAGVERPEGAPPGQEAPQGAVA